MPLATLEQLHAAPGYTARDNDEELLERASDRVAVTLYCSVYDVTDLRVAAALSRATIAQVQHWRALGADTGSVIATGGVSLASLKIDASSAAAATAADTLAPGVLPILMAAGLTGGGPFAAGWS